jgi:hypothetical protein
MDCLPRGVSSTTGFRPRRLGARASTVFLACTLLFAGLTGREGLAQGGEGAGLATLPAGWSDQLAAAMSATNARCREETENDPQVQRECFTETRRRGNRIQFLIGSEIEEIEYARDDAVARCRVGSMPAELVSLTGTCDARGRAYMDGKLESVREEFLLLLGIYFPALRAVE